MKNSFHLILVIFFIFFSASINGNNLQNTQDNYLTRKQLVYYHCYIKTKGWYSRIMSGYATKELDLKSWKTPKQFINNFYLNVYHCPDLYFSYTKYIMNHNDRESISEEMLDYGLNMQFRIEEQLKEEKINFSKDEFIIVNYCWVDGDFIYEPFSKRNTSTRELFPIKKKYYPKHDYIIIRLYDAW